MQPGTGSGTQEPLQLVLGSGRVLPLGLAGQAHVPAGSRARAGIGRRACGSAPPPPRRGHLPGGPGVTPPPPCGTTRMPSRSMTPTWQTSLTVSSTAWTRGTPKRGSSCFTLCLTSLRTWTAAVTERDAQPVRKLDLSRKGSAWFPNRPRPGLPGYRVREDGRWQPRAEQGPHALSGLAGRGVAPLVAERADEVQSAAGLVEGAGRSRRWSGLARVGDRAQHAGPGLEQAEPDRPPGLVSPGPGRACRCALVSSSDTTIAMSGLRSAMPHWCRMVTVKSRAVRTDPGSAPSAGVAIRGSQGRRARAGSGDGRDLPLARSAVSAVGISQRQPARAAG